MRGKVRKLALVPLSRFAAFPSDVDGEVRFFFYLVTASHDAVAVLHFGQSNLDTSRTVRRLQLKGAIQRLRNRSTISDPVNLFLPESVFLIASLTAFIKYEHRIKG